MTLSNFELNEPFGSVILRGLGQEWDLHNFAELVAVRPPNVAGIASLEWHVPADVDNPWGSRGNSASGCRLVFSGVRRFEQLGGDPKQSDGARAVRGISKAIPGELEYPFKQKWESDELFYLRVEMEDSGRIDIDAEVAAL